MTLAPPPELDARSRVAAARDQVSTELDGQAVILGLSDGVYYGLDPVGAAIWSLLEQPRTVAEIRDAVVDQFDVDAPTAEADILRLLAELRGRGLIQVYPAE